MSDIAVFPMRKLLTFIMAGGRGERLHPLTKDRAKPAVPFGGIYRIIDFPLSNAINSGIRKIHVLTQYKSISLARHLRAGWNIFDAELGEYIDVIPAQQRIGEFWYQGTADALYQNIYSIEQEQPEHVLILAGDHVYRMDYSEMLKAHRETNADVTVGVIEMEARHSPHFGVVEADSHGRIVGFEEKPLTPKTVAARPDRIFVSMGIYLFNRLVLEDVLTEDAREQTSHDFGRDILPKMVSQGRRVMAYDFRNAQGEPRYWRDIGTIDAYFEANRDLIQVTPVFNLYDREWPIRTYQEQFPPAKTVFAQEDRGGRVGMALDSLISAGCIVSGGRVQRSILSPNVRINSYSEVYDAVLMEGVDIARHAKVRRAIIDKDVHIPRGVQIGYDITADRRRFHVTESGIVVVPKGTVFADDGSVAHPGSARAEVTT